MGLLGDWAAQRGIALEVVADRADRARIPAGRPFVVSLGSEASAYDDAVPWLAAERAVLDRAVAGGVPILGICFGGQHLARALGATVGPASRPEVGWLEVETLAAEVVAAGPLAAVAPRRVHAPARRRAAGAVGDLRSGLPATARTSACSSTPRSRRRSRWAGRATTRSRWRAPAPMWQAVRAGGEAHAAGARVRAFALFDAFLASARSASRMPADALG